ncbi:MAG TPA: FAD-dependent oxidoreductase, partial [Gemmatimonadaceae bacterium]|nr:FAD-dependent oxidoreductase [Gemmatimonadaceae bacterium]
MTAARSPVDAVVIGAGIVGAACAEALARDGRRVLVLEQGVQGGGATGAAMGHLVAMDDSPAQLALTAYSLRRWRDVRDALPRDVERLDCGTLWLAECEDELEAVRAKGAVYAAAGVRAEVLDGDALASAEPELREGLAGALLVPDDCVVYPPAAARWLLREASALGAEVREGVAARAVRPNTVDTTEGPVRCDTVVVAAGCGARSLVPELPVVPKKGHLVVTDRYPGLCRHQLVELGYLASAHASERSSVAFNLQPRPSGQLLIGSSRQLAGFDAAIDR